MADLSEQIETQPTDGQALPPLRVHHLLLWMTVAGLLISGSMWFDRTARNGPPIKSQIVVGSFTLLAIIVSGALTFAGVGISERKRGYPFPAGPGEWLLWMLGCGTLTFLAAFIGIFIAFAFRLLTLYYIVVGIILFVLWVRANMRGFIFIADTTAWRIAIGLFGIIVPISCVANSALPMLVIGACVIGASIGDMRRAVSRGWLHWAGVGLMLATVAAFIGLLDGTRLFR